MLAVYSIICLAAVDSFSRHTINDVSLRRGAGSSSGALRDSGFASQRNFDLVKETVWQYCGGRRVGQGGWSKLEKEDKLRGKWFLEAL